MQFLQVFWRKWRRKASKRPLSTNVKHPEWSPPATIMVGLRGASGRNEVPIIKITSIALPPPLDIGHCTCLGIQLHSSAIEWKYAFLPGYGRGSVIICKALGSSENQQSAKCHRGEFEYYFSRLAESVLIAKGTKVERRLRFQGGAFEV